MVTVLSLLAGGAPLTTMVVDDAALARVEIRLAAASLPLARAIRPPRVAGATIDVDIDGDGLLVRIDAVPDQLIPAVNAAVWSLFRPRPKGGQAACLARHRDAAFSPEARHDHLVQVGISGVVEHCADARRAAVRRDAKALKTAALAVVAAGRFDSAGLALALVPLGEHPAWHAPTREPLEDHVIDDMFPGVTQPRVTIAWASSGSADAARDTVLADGYSARASYRLRQAEALVYGVAYARSGGVATATVVTDAGNEARVERELRQELTRPITADEEHTALARQMADARASTDSIGSMVDAVWHPAAESVSPVPQEVMTFISVGEPRR